MSKAGRSLEVLDGLSIMLSLLGWNVRVCDDEWETEETTPSHKKISPLVSPNATSDKYVKSQWFNKFTLRAYSAPSAVPGSKNITRPEAPRSPQISVWFPLAFRNLGKVNVNEMLGPRRWVVLNGRSSGVDDRAQPGYNYKEKCPALARIKRRQPLSVYLPMCGTDPEPLEGPVVLFPHNFPKPRLVCDCKKMFMKQNYSAVFLD